MPWLGSGLYLVNGSAQRTDLARSLLLKWYRTHGPIIRVKQFGQNIVYVVESDDIREFNSVPFDNWQARMVFDDFAIQLYRARLHSTFSTFVIILQLEYLPVYLFFMYFMHFSIISSQKCAKNISLNFEKFKFNI